MNGTPQFPATLMYLEFFGFLLVTQVLMHPKEVHDATTLPADLLLLLRPSCCGVWMHFETCSGGNRQFSEEANTLSELMRVIFENSEISDNGK